MTSLATSLGALPIALSLGAAATSRIPLGIVVVGGIMFSLILTLFDVAVLIYFLNHVATMIQLPVVIANIATTDPDIIAAGNIGCMTQIASATAVPVLHPVELIDWATGGPVPEQLKSRVGS